MFPLVRHGPQRVVAPKLRVQRTPVVDEPGRRGRRGRSGCRGDYSTGIRCGLLAATGRIKLPQRGPEAREHLVDGDVGSGR